MRWMTLAMVRLFLQRRSGAKKSGFDDVDSVYAALLHESNGAQTSGLMRSATPLEPTTVRRAHAVC